MAPIKLNKNEIEIIEQMAKAGFESMFDKKWDEMSENSLMLS